MNTHCHTSAQEARHAQQAGEAQALELEMERIENDMRTILSRFEEFPLTYREGFSRKTVTYDRADVVSEMASLDSDELDAALAEALAGNGVEGLKRLNDLKERAIEQIIGTAPIREAAMFSDPEDNDFFEYREAV